MTMAKDSDGRKFNRILNMIVSKMAKPFMCLVMSEAIEAIVKGKRKNDCNFFKDCAMAM